MPYSVRTVCHQGRRLLFTLGACLAAQGALWAGAAAAQSAEDASTSHRLDAPLLPVRLEGHGALTWEGEFGVGGRVEYPVLAEGLASGSRDELSVSVGLDVVFVAFEGSDPRTFWPTATVQWTLGITPKFSFFPELGLAGQIDRDGWQGVFPNIGFGGRYHIWRSVAVMGRLGWPMAISLGATF
jgi:hypothetical protein